MIVKIYVEKTPDSGVYKLLDLFDDENININFKLKDSSDISKAFSTYSQTFNIPATPNNNSILNYFYNPEVSFSNRYINAKIYVNEQLFKFGKITLSDGRAKFNKLTTIQINFFTGVSTLKETIGEDKLSSLIKNDDTDIQISWDDYTVKNYLESSISGITVPLISNKRLWTYEDSGSADISWVSSSVLPSPYNHRGVEKEELRPAIAFSSIVQSIQDKYKLNIDFPLQFRPEYTKLWVHCTNSTPPMSGIMPIDSGSFYFIPPESAAILWGISGNVSSSVFTINRFSDSTDYQTSTFLFQFNPIRVLGGDEDVSIEFEFVDLRSGSYGDILFTSKQVLSNNSTQITTGMDIGLASKFGITIANPLIFKINIKASSPISWNNLNYIFTAFEVSPSYSYVSYNNTSTKLHPENLKLLNMVPDMKIIDFLSSMFKVFNIRVREDNFYSNFMHWETPEDFIGIEKDYTPFVDIENYNLKPQQLYKNYLFSHKQPKYRSSVDWKTANVTNPNSNEFGQLIYKSTDFYAKGDYKIDTLFSIVPIVNINNTIIPTWYGFTSDKIKDSATYGSASFTPGAGEYIPNFGDFTIFYYSGNYRLFKRNFADTNGIEPPYVNPEDYAYIAFKVSSSYEQILRANYISIANGVFQTGSVFNGGYNNSLGFKDEINIIPTPNQFVYEKNLYSNYYSEILETLNNSKKLLYTYNLVLPAKEILEFDLRNDIIIGNQKFDIEEANINIVTGKTSLILINKL